MWKLAAAYLGIVAIMSLVTFCVYGWDKRQAQNHGQRTPERLMHRLALFGGWPGAYFGQRFFRHKTQKSQFQLVFWATGLFHLALIGTAIYFWAKSYFTPRL